MSKTAFACLCGGADVLRLHSFASRRAGGAANLARIQIGDLTPSDIARHTAGAIRMERAKVKHQNTASAEVSGDFGDSHPRWTVGVPKTAESVGVLPWKADRLTICTATLASTHENCQRTQSHHCHCVGQRRWLQKTQAAIPAMLAAATTGQPRRLRQRVRATRPGGIVSVTGQISQSQAPCGGESAVS